MTLGRRRPLPQMRTAQASDWDRDGCENQPKGVFRNGIRQFHCSLSDIFGYPTFGPESVAARLSVRWLCISKARWEAPYVGASGVGTGRRCDRFRLSGSAK